MRGGKITSGTGSKWIQNSSRTVTLPRRCGRVVHKRAAGTQSENASGSRTDGHVYGHGVAFRTVVPSHALATMLKQTTVAKVPNYSKKKTLATTLQKLLTTMLTKKTLAIKVKQKVLATMQKKPKTLAARGKQKVLATMLKKKTLATLLSK